MALAVRGADVQAGCKAHRRDARTTIGAGRGVGSAVRLSRQRDGAGCRRLHGRHAARARCVRRGIAARGWKNSPNHPGNSRHFRLSPATAQTPVTRTEMLSHSVIQWVQKPPFSSVDRDGGGGGIRTRETLRPVGFQDRCIQPLCHPSKLFVLRHLYLFSWCDNFHL